MAAACGLGAVMLFLPQVQSLQFGPLRAEMREKIEEVSATLDQLRGLATDFARMSVLETLEQRALTTLHINQTEVENILKPLDSRIEILIERDIEFSARKPESGEAFSNCFLPIYKNIDVNEIRDCIDKFGVFTYSVEENIKKLSEFQKTRHIKSLEINIVR